MASARLTSVGRLRGRPMNPAPCVVGRAGQGRGVEIQWEDTERVARAPARFQPLGRGCGSCVGEISGERRLDPAMVRGDLRPVGTRPLGQPALCFASDDGHSTSVFPYDTLCDLCPGSACVSM
jgi:hypothetical protein